MMHRADIWTGIQLDLTLGIDSMVRIAKLGWLSRRKPMILLACLSWVCLDPSDASSSRFGV